MTTANQLKPGAVIEVNRAPHIVESVVKQTPSARGASTLYKIRARHLLAGGKVDLTCRGDDAFPEPNFRKRLVQFLYDDGELCHFMDVETFDQLAMAASALEDERRFLTDGLEGIGALILEDRLVGIQLPDAVALELVECDPAIKGATATSRGKSATTQTGLVIQVPEYMSQGEVVRVDTRTGKFLARA